MLVRTTPFIRGSLVCHPGFSHELGTSLSIFPGTVLVGEPRAELTVALGLTDLACGGAGGKLICRLACRPRLSRAFISSPEVSRGPGNKRARSGERREGGPATALQSHFVCRWCHAKKPAAQEPAETLLPSGGCGPVLGAKDSRQQNGAGFGTGSPVSACTPLPSPPSTQRKELCIP